MSATNTMEANLLNHIFGLSALANVANHYLALFTTVPTADDGSGAVEPTIGVYAYARVVLANNGTTWAAGTLAVPSVKACNIAATFAAATTASWGNVKGWGIYDAASGGNLLHYGTFSSAFTVAVGEVVEVPVGSLNFSFSFLSKYFSKYMADLTFGDRAVAAGLTPPATLRIKAYTTTLSDVGAGTEVTGGSYTYIDVTNDATSWTINSQTVTNDNTLSFPKATADWGTIYAFGVWSGSNLICNINLSSPVVVSSGNTLRIAASTGITATVD